MKSKDSKINYSGYFLFSGTFVSSLWEAKVLAISQTLGWIMLSLLWAHKVMANVMGLTSFLSTWGMWNKAGIYLYSWTWSVSYKKVINRIRSMVD